MALRGMTWAWVALLFTLMGLCGVAVAAQEVAQNNPTAWLATGSAQAVLALCLVTVTGALGYVSRELVRALRERIAALEDAAKLSANKADAERKLADAMDRLREHCEGKMK